MAWIDRYSQSLVREFFVRRGEQRKIVILDKEPYEAKVHFYKSGIQWTYAACANEGCIICNVIPKQNIIAVSVYDITIDNMATKKLFIMRGSVIQSFVECINSIKDFNVNDLSLTSYMISRNRDFFNVIFIYLGRKDINLDKQLLNYSEIFKPKSKEEQESIVKAIRS